MVGKAHLLNAALAWSFAPQGRHEVGPYDVRHTVGPCEANGTYAAEVAGPSE
jgi:hypothetical protein